MRILLLNVITIKTWIWHLSDCSGIGIQLSDAHKFPGVNQTAGQSPNQCPSLFQISLLLRVHGFSVYGMKEKKIAKQEKENNTLLHFQHTFGYIGKNK